MISLYMYKYASVSALPNVFQVSKISRNKKLFNILGIILGLAGEQPAPPLA